MTDQTEPKSAGATNPHDPIGVASASSVNGPLPAELKGWNWGAFFLTWIWGVNHNVWISLLVLLSFIPFIGPTIALVTAIVLGVKGNEWAWANRRFEGVEEFKKVQHAWMVAGLIVFVAGIVVFFSFAGIVLAFLFHTHR